MKFALASDIHLEFGTISLENTENADVLILSGDICVESDLLERKDNEIEYKDESSRTHIFFEECCARFPAVIYIAGNHEHYHGDYNNTITNLRNRLGYLTNLYILDKQLVKLNDVTFIGGTLWTDMNKEDPHTLYRIKSYMNDYRIIKNSGSTVTFKDEDGKFHTRMGKFSPEESVVDHKAMLKFIADIVDSNVNSKFVVVGHHAPSKLSTKPQYEKAVLVNGAYSSDLSEFILDRPQIKFWTHGHTHHEFDYMLGSTRIVCNPRGYIYEASADNFQLKYFEV